MNPAVSNMVVSAACAGLPAPPRAAALHGAGSFQKQGGKYS